MLKKFAKLSATTLLPSAVAAGLVAVPMFAGAQGMSAYKGNDYCPAQVTRAFSGPPGDDECVAVLVTMKNGDTQICGCQSHGVTKQSSVDAVIAPADQDAGSVMSVSVQKIKSKTDPDPCVVYIVGGVPITYCW